MVYQALRQAGLITYMTPETVHSAQRRDPLIAASIPAAGSLAEIRFGAGVRYSHLQACLPGAVT